MECQFCGKKMLSKREMEILHLLVKQLSLKEIASTMGISYQTAKNFVTSMERKLDAYNITTLVIQALKQGLVKL